jgi:hypothetical protein
MNMKQSFLIPTSIRALIITATFWSLTVAAFAGGTNHPKFIATQVFINNHKFGDTNGCSGDFGVTGCITCGHSGHVSEVTWRFLRSSPEGDIYKITRRYPSDSDTPSTATKEVTYSGKPLVLWQDDNQKIILRPKP